MAFKKNEEECCETACQPHHSFGKKILMVLVAVLLVYTTLYVGTLIKNNIKKYSYIGEADHMERSISVSGVGKVTAKNDIAMTTIGYSTIDKDVAKAQAQNKKVMDKIMSELKAMGIEEKDMTSNYSIYPEYNYVPDRGSELKGYRVTNNVTVKIRDLSKISVVLGLPGKYGANEVTGLSFTIDDTEVLKQQAREIALNDAKAKAISLANQLGVRLEELMSYGDYEISPSYPVYGMGGSYDLKAEMRVSPTVSSGSQDITMHVNLVYKIVPRRK